MRERERVFSNSCVSVFVYLFSCVTLDVIYLHTSKLTIPLSLPLSLSIYLSLSLSINLLSVVMCLSHGGSLLTSHTLSLSISLVPMSTCVLRS